MDLVDSKYIGLVSSRLSKFKRVKADLYNFRCPLCGDSQKHKNKARGYVYPLKADMNYKCHNCGASSTFSNFLKTLDPTLHKQYVFEKFQTRNTGKGSIIEKAAHELVDEYELYAAKFPESAYKHGKKLDEYGKINRIKKYVCEYVIINQLDTNKKNELK